MILSNQISYPLIHPPTYYSLAQHPLTLNIHSLTTLFTHYTHFLTNSLTHSLQPFTYLHFTHSSFNSLQQPLTNLTQPKNSLYSIFSIHSLYSLTLTP
mmetsp:Transcript_12603/g.17221  ORF Transcript_12603/g.17221 Transcript_12603/m.17221 type:complete len:98 (-) Transcript_12603:93-386(-)